MPNRTTRRAVAKKTKPEDQTIMEITTGGVEYHLEIKDLSALDEERLERASRPRNADGTSIPGERGIILTHELGSGEFSVRTIAGLVFLRQSEGDPTVTYEAVAKALKFTDLESVKMLSQDELDAKLGGAAAGDPSL